MTKKTLNKRGGASTDLVDIIQALLEIYNTWDLQN